MELKIRPYDEKGKEILFLSHNDENIWKQQTGYIGYLRGDFGSSGTEFFATFFLQDTDIETNVFGKTLDTTINMLREPNMPLASRSAMKKFCDAHPANMEILSDFTSYHGYRIDTSDGYTFMLRAFPYWGDYNFYVFVYCSNKLTEIQDNTTHFYVGQIHPEWRGLSDGMILEWNELSGFTLYFLLSGVTNQELDSITTHSEFDIRFYPVNNIGFFSMKFGSLPWGNCAFSPNLYVDPPCFPELELNVGYALNVVLIDTKQGEIRYLRQIGLGHDFSSLVRLWALDSLNQELNTQYYTDSIKQVFSSYSPEMLAEKSIIRYVQTT